MLKKYINKKSLLSSSAVINSNHLLAALSLVYKVKRQTLITGRLLKLLLGGLLFLLATNAMLSVATDFGGPFGDFDADGFLNSVDIDDDGDGLIEIATAGQLNMLRNNLAGTGLDFDNSDGNPYAGGVSYGCGGYVEADGSLITTCDGYELTADLDLNELVGFSYTEPNWQPIGHCVVSTCNAIPLLFSAEFDGNGHSISNMRIQADPAANGVGFFGAVAIGKTIRRVHLVAAEISYANPTGSLTSSNLNGMNNVGGLVGWGAVNTMGGIQSQQGVVIIDSSVSLKQLAGRDNVGGLIGNGKGAVITSSSAQVGELTGRFYVGGLVGDGSGAMIETSSASARSIAGYSSVGGLVARAANSRVAHSASRIGSITGEEYLGGFFGSAVDSLITSSYALVNNVSGGRLLGGFGGGSERTTVLASVAVAAGVLGANTNQGFSYAVGGLVGSATDSTIGATLAAVGTITGRGQVAGLLGSGDNSHLINSYALTSNIYAASGIHQLFSLEQISASASVSASYWQAAARLHNTLTGNLVDTSFLIGRGFSQSATALRQPSARIGIYNGWNGICGDAANTPVWNFGSPAQYPVVACFSASLSAERLRAAMAEALADRPPLCAVELSNPHFLNTDGDALVDFCDEDDDNDGIVDAVDNCPHTLRDWSLPNSRDLNRDGCPDNLLYPGADFYDTDGDGVFDNLDVDDDGDGLIELSTAEELNLMRYNLAGTGLDVYNSDQDSRAGGRTDGCGGGTNAFAMPITTCSGYELTADLDLNDLPADPVTGANWQPVGYCVGSCFEANNMLFSGNFDGNGHRISNMHMHLSDEANGVGFFGAVALGRSISGVHLVDANISYVANFSNTTMNYAGGLVGWGESLYVGGIYNWQGISISSSSVSLGNLPGGRYVGGLIGYGRGAILTEVSVSATNITGLDYVGGLIGDGSGARVTSSSVRATAVRGVSDFVGGLAGVGRQMEMKSSAARISQISGAGHVGGLVGYGDQIRLSASYALVHNLRGTHHVGGLVGLALRTTISSAAAIVQQLVADYRYAGGLVGNGITLQITASAATVYSISAPGWVGGLVGFATKLRVTNSLALATNIRSSQHVQQLAGYAPSALVRDSYWLDTTRVQRFDGAPVYTSFIVGLGVEQTPADLGRSTSNIYANWRDVCSLENPTPVWDFGGNTEYPAINCFADLDAADLRAWSAETLAGRFAL